MTTTIDGLLQAAEDNLKKALASGDARFLDAAEKVFIEIWQNNSRSLSRAQKQRALDGICAVWDARGKYHESETFAIEGKRWLDARYRHSPRQGNDDAGDGSISGAMLTALGIAATIGATLVLLRQINE